MLTYEVPGIAGSEESRGCRVELERLIWGNLVGSHFIATAA